MRKFIRHPADIPLEYGLQGRDGRRRERLRNVSLGGLCFHGAHGLEPGTRVHITISVCQPPLDVDGVVAWSAALGGGYEVGVAFDGQAAESTARMVEQICLVEQYRLDMKRKQGRSLSEDQAAQEERSHTYAGDPR